MNDAPFLEGYSTKDLSPKAKKDLAYEEVVCDASEALFKDGNLAGVLRQMQAKDSHLYNKFVDGVKKFIAKIKSLLSGHDVESKGGQLVDSMKEELYKFEAVWMKALEEAGENYKASAIIEVADGSDVIKYQNRSDFKNQVDEVVNDTYDKEVSHICVCNTPNDLIDLGLKQRPMLMTVNHAYSITVSEQQARA